MTPRTHWDSEALHAGTSAAQSTLGGLRLAPGGAGPGIETDVANTISDGNNFTEDEIGRSEDTAGKTREGVDGLDEAEEKGRKEVSETGPDGTQLSGDGSGADAGVPRGGGLGGSAVSGAGGDGGMRPLMSSAVPANQIAPTMPQMSTPQMPQMSMPSMPSMPMSSMPMSLPMMTQADLSSSPNRSELVRQLMDQGYSGGGTLGEKSSGGMARRVQEIAERLVNNQPPIPYTWGGGHGPNPGISGGIRDGGVADQFGDYAKRGVDCSGLSRWMTYLAYGVDIGSSTSQVQYVSGMPVSGSQAIPGDMVFPPGNRPPGHVQVYVGNGMVIEAQKSGTNLMFSQMQSGSEFRRFVQ